MIIDFILGYLITQTVLLIWFYSPFRISLGKIIFDKGMYTTDQFETYILILSPFLGKLLSCYICFSFWTSIFLGCIGSYLFYNCDIMVPIITGMTYPAICYLYKSFIDKS